MRPLERQLEDRFAALTNMRDSLVSLETEDIPQTMLHDLGIELNLLDIDTGVTHPSVMPYFLPRTNFPTCRDMQGGERDEVWEHGIRIDKGEENPLYSTHSFLWTFSLSLHKHSFLLDRNRERRFFSRKVSNYGWMNLLLRHEFEKLSVWPPRHVYSFICHIENDTCFTSGNSDTVDGRVSDHKIGLDDPPIDHRTCSSHEVRSAIFYHALKKCPSVTEVMSLVELVRDGVARQIEELKQLPSKSPEHFHHILPRLIVAHGGNYVRVLYAYFDDEKLRVQFTPVLDFEQFDFKQFKRRSPPGVKYNDSMDWYKYQEMMDTLLKWMMPIVQTESTSTE